MDDRAIGVFDSGVGGLTAVRELRAILPHENILYFGDTGRVPYGTRSRETIRKYAIQDIIYLLGRNVKAIVAACGTVSANITDDDIAQIGVQVSYTGVVKPATRAALETTRNGRVGVIATSAAIRSGAYNLEMARLDPSVQVFGQACPLFVPLVENGMTARDNQITRLTAEMYLDSLKRDKIDTLILGCTHFPLLYDIIGDVLGGDVRLIDAGGAAARHVKSLLERQNSLSQRQSEGQTRYRVTDTVDIFVNVAENFLHENIAASTEFVDLDWLTAPERQRR